VDLEKAFDRVLREIMQWAMRRLGAECLVRVLMNMYEESRISVSECCAE